MQRGNFTGNLVRLSVSSLFQDLDQRIADLVPQVTAIRHNLHQHPELGFEEVRTQAAVRSWLEQLGLQPKPAAKTGLVVDLAPHANGPTIALRADLDCLPMQETTELTYRSIHPGRAHKCGHDGHTAIMLGVASLLAPYRHELPGNVRLLFQPDEEGSQGGGAKIMVAEGVLDDVDEVYALHNWPAYPYGEIRVCAGPLMAATNPFFLTVTGAGGHGSQPQVCRDPIVAAAHWVCAIQTVVSRGLGYEGGAVVSVGQFTAGNTTNVIPDQAELKGTIRTFDDRVTDRVLERMQEITTGIGATFGVETKLEYRNSYPVLVNDPHCVAAVRRVATRLVGDDRVSDRGLPMAGAEDFAYMTRATQGAYFFIGTGNAEGTTPGCHHPDFDFNDDIMPLGMSMMVGLVADRLGLPLPQASEGGSSNAANTES